MPDPAPPVLPPHHTVPLILDKIKDFIEACNNSTWDSTKPEWTYLKTMFLRLHDKKNLSALEQHLFSMLSPTIMKFVQDDPSLAGKIDGATLLTNQKDSHHG